MTANEAEEDAAMRALFSELDRPPMGDERFVAAVMTRVEHAKAGSAARRSAITLGAVAVTAAALWPVRDALVAGLILPLQAYAQTYVGGLPAFGAGATGLMVAAAATFAAWAYAERN